MIQAKHIEKSFGDFKAVAGLDLQVRRGECFGLLGPNGAGKSTLIGMIYGTVKRSAGDLQVFGFDPNLQDREIKKRLGVVTQENALDDSLTVLENMMLYCGFIGVPRNLRKKRVEELLDYMNLSHKRDARIQMLSGGMKRRLVFVRALLGQPELLILDEPTTGLDPAVRHLLWNKVKELHQSGTTIVLTTHYMHEAEVLCGRLVIMNQGRIVAEGSPSQMIQQHTPGYVGIFSPEQETHLSPLVARRPELAFHKDSSAAYIRTGSLQNLTDFVSENRMTPLQIRPANLEDVFLKLTGQELAADA